MHKINQLNNIMKKFKISILFAILLAFANQSFGQSLGYSGVLGYARPQGDAFTDASGNILSSIGISYEADLLYFHGFMNDKLGLGLTYVGSVLFGKNSSATLDIGMYGLGLYGLKGMYRLRPIDKRLSPYAAVSIGLSEFETPEMTSGNQVLVPADRSFSFGMRPEIGLELGHFVFSLSYFTPMNYDVQSVLGTFKGSAGELTYGIGYRGYFGF